MHAAPPRGNLPHLVPDKTGQAACRVVKSPSPLRCKLYHKTHDPWTRHRKMKGLNPSQKSLFCWQMSFTVSSTVMGWYLEVFLKRQIFHHNIWLHKTLQHNAYFVPSQVSGHNNRQRPFHTANFFGRIYQPLKIVLGEDLLWVVWRRAPSNMKIGWFTKRPRRSCCNFQRNRRFRCGSSADICQQIYAYECNNINVENAKHFSLYNAHDQWKCLATTFKLCASIEKISVQHWTHYYATLSN